MIACINADASGSQSSGTVGIPEYELQNDLDAIDSYWKPLDVLNTFLASTTFDRIREMQYYQHRFEKVEDYLHHRPPYLLVDEVLSIEPAQIVTLKTVTEEDFFMAGHFPGAPIFPGAMMQELTTQSAGVLIAAEYNPMQEFKTDDPFFNEYALGVLVKIKQARYRSFARPGDILRVQVRLLEKLSGVFDFAATISVDDQMIMRNMFQLTNMKSTILQGK